MNEKIFKHEVQNFKKVLTQSAFRTSPFDSLKKHINQKLVKKQEFIDMENKHKKSEAVMDVSLT